MQGSTTLSAAFTAEQMLSAVQHVFGPVLQDRWRKVPGVQFHHLGQIQFRDTPEEYTLLQVNSERFAVHLSLSA